MDWKKHLVAAALALAALPAAAAEEAKVVEQVEGEKRAWSASLDYGHASTTMSFDKRAEQDYNPIYMHTLSFRPQYDLGESFFVAGQLAFEQELTNSDWTTYERQVIWYDANLEAGWKGWTESESGIRLSGNVRVALPLSMMSQAQSQLLAISPGVTASRRFDVLKGLNVSLSGRFNKRFHEYTTAAVDDHGFLLCPDEKCDAYRNTGIRNSAGEVSGALSVSLVPVEKLSLTASYGLQQAMLYDATTTPVEIAGGQQVEPGTYAQESDSRFAQNFSLGASYALLDELNLGAAVSTGSNQLTPDGHYRSPFFNRFTMVSVNLGLSVDALADRLF